MNQLQEVRMGLFSGTLPELGFVKFLLANSLVLEKMLIQPPKGTIAEDGLKILKEVTRFQRASSKAEVIYLDPL